MNERSEEHSETYADSQRDIEFDFGPVEEYAKDL